MYYFPLIPRLQRLYASKATAKDMRWHDDHDKEDGVMHHPSDSKAWFHFDQVHPSFFAESRNVSWDYAQMDSNRLVNRVSNIRVGQSL